MILHDEPLTPTTTDKMKGKTQPKLLDREELSPSAQTVDQFDAKNAHIKLIVYKQNTEVNSQSETRNSFKLSACTYCRAAVNAKLQPTAFERVHRLCHCCKMSAGDIKRDVVNVFHEIGNLRFWAPWFERNESKFMAKAFTAMPLTNIECSGSPSQAIV